MAGLAACDISLFGADGSLLATSASGADGNFEFAFETTDTPPTGFARLEATNCTYEDEYTGDTITGANLSTVFALPTPLDGSRMQLAVTPLTRLLDETLSADAGSSDAGDYDADLHAQMVASLSEAMLGSDVATDILTVQPAVAVDADSATADEDRKAYGLALAALSAMGDLDLALLSLNLEATGLDAGSTDAMIDAAGMFELSGRNQTGTKATVALAGLMGAPDDANTAPEAVAAEGYGFSGHIGDTFSVDLATLFTDADGDELSISVAGLTQDMTLTGSLLSGRLVHDGKLVLAVTANDGRGGAAYIDYAILSSEAPLPPVNNTAPVAGDDSVTLDSTTATVDLDVLANDTDADGDTLSILSVSDVGNGISAVVAGGKIRITGIEEGDWTFTYKIEDGQGGFDTATVSVSVPAAVVTPPPPPPPPPPVNNAPVTADDSVTLPSTTASLDVDVLANDSDPDGDTLVLTDVQSSANGMTVAVVGNKVRVTGLQEGVYTASYTVGDGNGGSANGLLEVLVPAAPPPPPPPNTAPVAANDSVTLASTTASVDVDVLANDTDEDGDTLTLVSAFSLGDSATASVVDGKVRVTGVSEGVANVTYTITDGNGGEDTATLVVTVPSPPPPPPPPPPANNAPVGVDDAVTLSETTATLDVDVLANDTDADNDVLTVDWLGEVGTGISAEIVNNKVRVTGVTEGEWSLFYGLSDGNGGSSDAMLTVTVPAAPPPPPPPPPPPSGSSETMTARGTIGGFGSVIVNGQRYETDTATVNVNGVSGALKDLAVGQWVTVEADVPTTGDPIATSIVYEAVLLGPVQEVSATGFKVLDQVIHVTDDTVFESDIDTSVGLFEGDVVEVSAIVNPDGSLDATYVEMADDPTADYSVKGDVTSVDTVASTFTINALTVNYTGAAPTVGQTVKVQGKTITAGGAFNASDVEVKAEETAGDAGQTASVTGIAVGDPQTEIFEIGGVRVSLSDATVYSGGVFADAVEGVRMSVEGTVQGSGQLDGVLLADAVEFRLEATHIIDANLESIDTTNGTFTVRGVEFATNAYTAYKDDLDTTNAAFGFGDFQVGDTIRVQAHVTSGGQVYANTLRRLEYKNGDLVVDGPVSAVTNGPLGVTLSVLGIPMEVNANSVVFDADGNFVSMAALTLAVGDEVELIATDYTTALYVDMMTWYPKP